VGVVVDRTRRSARHQKRSSGQDGVGLTGEALGVSL
jgi:hypothetical protein